MKTVLFYPRIENTIIPSYAPLGIMSIATYLNANNHKAVIHDRFYSTESAESIIKSEKPDIIGISVISQTFIKDAITISKAAKSVGVPVVWGGCAASAIDEKVLRSGFVDYVSINEGELTWLELANAFDKGEPFDDIKSISYIKNGRYVRTEDREFVDLHKLPDIDWGLVNPNNYMQKSYGINKMLSTYTSKGCFGKCAFCYNPVYHHSMRRRRPLEQVIREMKFLVKNYGVDGFEFTDEVMFINRTEAIDFCNKLLENNLNIYWNVYLNVATISTAEDFDLMYKAGCRSIFYGVETGSERMLKSVNKYGRLDKVAENLRLCKKSGILPIAMFMLGLPDEDAADIKETIDLSKQLEGAVISFSFFTPLPGTKLYKELIKENRMSEPESLEEHSEVIELEKLYKNFSKVPTIELLTIRKFMRLKGLFRNGDNQFEKVLLMTLKAWSGRGLIHFIRNAFSSSLTILDTLGLFLHPTIRKKYGLYFKK